MKILKAICAAALLAGSAASVPAFAHGSSVHFGIGVGFPAYYPAPYPYYYPPPAYYYPPPVYAAPAPPVYVEQQAAPAPPAPQAQAAPQQDSFWYYCPDSKTYYPYVKSCASAWQRVQPRPGG